MNKNIAIGIVVVVVLVVGGILWSMQSPKSATNLPLPTSQAVPTPETNPVPTPVAPVTNPTSLPNPLPIVPKAVTHTITIQKFAFNLAGITIKKGDTVVWTNKDAMGHTVTGNNGVPSSPTIPTNGTYSYTFNDAGTFVYHCAIHPAMTGNVIVE